MFMLTTSEGICIILREHDKAIADLDKAISLNPNFRWAYGNRGNYGERKGYSGL